MLSRENYRWLGKWHECRYVRQNSPAGDPQGVTGRSGRGAQTDRQAQRWRRQDRVHGASHGDPHGDLGLHVKAARSR